MALLDVYVTPLRRCLGGHLEPVGLAGGTSHLPPHPSAAPGAGLPDMGDLIAALRRRLPETIGEDLPWCDEGETVFASQVAADAWHALRAFAVDEYYPAPGFAFGADSHTHPGLERAMAGGRCGFRHLIRQHAHQGLYVPTDFPKPFALPDWIGPGPAPVVGSSVSLLRELNHLRRALGLTYDLGDQRWAEQFEPDDPLERVKAGWVFLRHAARLSVKHKLPMVLAHAGC